MKQPLLSIEHLSKRYGNGRHNGYTVALNDVTLDVQQGDILGIVGESGSGKSTLLRCLMRLERPDTGSIRYDGIDVLKARGKDLRRFRREVQMVFQDPYSSLNPRMTVEQLVGEGIIIHSLATSKADRRQQVADTLSAVGINAIDMNRHPRDFSGGQRQRIAIARALAIHPRLLVCDEVVSALDVSIQAQVINLLLDLNDTLNITILFVAHNLAVVRQTCPELIVMQTGSVVERGARTNVFATPTSQYTMDLLRAVPVPDPAVPFARAASSATVAR